jgi:hypothetical protein
MQLQLVYKNLTSSKLDGPAILHKQIRLSKLDSR